MKIAILGATGLVGRKMLELLEDQAWADAEPRLLVSPRSAGTRLRFRGRDLECRAAGPDSFAGVRIALFSAGGEAALRYGPIAAEAGAWVIDNSSAFRGDRQIPLVVPEINGDLLPPTGGAIIANPNCSTIQIAMAAAPLDRAFGLREVHATTLQAVSGAGGSALQELRRQEAGEPPAAGSAFSRPMARNVLPAIGAPLPDGSFTEETKVLLEMRKILRRGEDLKISCTAVRVPVHNCHSAAVRFVLEREVTPAEASGVMAAWPGLVVAAGPHDFATPREIDGQKLVHVGRLRSDPGQPNALLAWVVADNLLKGAAWNAVQIAERLAHLPPPGGGS